jgi:hypothetical protein
LYLQVKRKEIHDEKISQKYVLVEVAEPTINKSAASPRTLIEMDSPLWRWYRHKMYE